jgi:hypothetical protein
MSKPNDTDDTATCEMRTPERVPLNLKALRRLLALANNAFWTAESDAVRDECKRVLPGHLLNLAALADVLEGWDSKRGVLTNALDIQLVRAVRALLESP